MTLKWWQVLVEFSHYCLLTIIKYLFILNEGKTMKLDVIHPIST